MKLRVELFAVDDLTGHYRDAAVTTCHAHLPDVFTLFNLQIK